MIPGKPTFLTANPDPGWEFVNWSGDLSGSANPTTVAMDADKNVTATFAPLPTYTVVTNTVGNGNVALDPPGGTYYEGVQVALTATTDLGWAFDGWSGDASGSDNPLTLTMDADKSITATFIEVSTFDLVFAVNGSGSVALDPAGGIYSEGTLVTLTASPILGWQFDGWGGDLTGTDNPATFTMDGNKAVTADFSESPPEIIPLLNHRLRR